MLPSSLLPCQGFGALWRRQVRNFQDNAQGEEAANLLRVTQQTWGLWSQRPPDIFVSLCCLHTFAFTWLLPAGKEPEEAVQDAHSQGDHETYGPAVPMLSM